MTEKFDGQVATAEVRSFTELIESIGRCLSGREPGVYLFRGQDQVHHDAPGVESVRSRFGRSRQPNHALLKRTIQDTAEAVKLRDRFAHGSLAAEALVAHYELTPTRMLDVTQVAHVAASFALNATPPPESKAAVVYVFGPARAIEKASTNAPGAFSVAAVANHFATRPQRQAAWVLHHPDPGHNFAEDVIARFEIPWECRRSFWRGFKPYSNRWLVQADVQWKVLALRIHSTR
jgi:hypothetical protein